MPANPFAIIVKAVVSPEISVNIFQNTRPKVPVELEARSSVKRNSYLKTKFHKNCALLGYYAASSDNPLPTFRDNLLGQS